MYYSKDLPPRQLQVYTEAKIFFDRNGKLPTMKELAELIEDNVSVISQKRMSSIVTKLKQKNLWPPEAKENLMSPPIKAYARLEDANEEAESVCTIVSLLVKLNRIARKRVLNYVNELMDQLDG